MSHQRDSKESLSVIIWQQIILRCTFKAPATFSSARPARSRSTLQLEQAGSGPQSSIAAEWRLPTSLLKTLVGKT
jgi:hypothetical protein